MHAAVVKRFTRPAQPKGLDAHPAWSECCKCEEENECTMCGLFSRKHKHFTSMHSRMAYVQLALSKKFPIIRREIFNEIQEFIFDRSSVKPSLLNRTKLIRIKKVLIHYWGNADQSTKNYKAFPEINRTQTH